MNPSINQQLCCIAKKITEINSQLGGEILSEDAYDVLGINAVPEDNPEAQAALREDLQSLGPIADPKIALAKWFENGVYGKKITFVGDSTTVQLTGSFLDPYVVPGGPLEGCVVTYLGYSGETAASILASHIGAIIAEAADLYVISVGINDVRTGGADQAVLTARIISLVNAVRAGVPNAAIILRMPNTFLTTDVGGLGYVVPNSSAQAYSSIMRDSYDSLANYWTDVYMLDTQRTVYGEVSLASTASMTDQIHPSSNPGYRGMRFRLLEVIGQPQEYSVARAKAAIIDGPSFPPAVYDGALRDPDQYVLVASGIASSSGAFFDIGFESPAKVPAFFYKDVVWNHGNAPFELTTTSILFQALADGFVYIRFNGQTPPAWTPNNRVEIYRSKYAYSTPVETAARRELPFALPVRISTAGSNFIDVSPLDPTMNINSTNGISWINTTDTLAVGSTTQALTSATFAVQSDSGTGTVRIGVTGSFAALANSVGYIYNTSASPNRARPWVVPITATKTSTSVPQGTDVIIPCDPSSGAMVQNLPDATLSDGRIRWYVRKGSSVNTITLTAVAGQTIDGRHVTPATNTQTLVMAGICGIISDGANWLVVIWT